jgi:Ca2+-binding RTX toxin-like protein
VGTAQARSRSRSIRRLLIWTIRTLGLAGVAMLLASPAPASAATVSMQAGVLSVSATGDERNDMVITVNGRFARVRDTGAPAIAGAGCSSGPGDAVTCRLAANSRLEVDAGGRDDAVVNDSELPAVIYGRAGDDTLIGGERRDRLDGGGGFDTMDGRGGDDSITTRGRFIDRIACGEGDDFVYADASDAVAPDCEDVQRPGDAGEDVKPGSPPSVVVPEFAPLACTQLFRGTDGDDAASVSAGGVVMLGSPGPDRLEGGPNDDCIFGAAGSDELSGEEGDDFLGGGGSLDRLRGGAGADRLGGDAGQDRLAGGAGDDVAAGGSGRDAAWGGRGDDLIHGGSGRDLLDGGAGDDVLEGGKRADRVRAGKGSNRLSGGGGDDVLRARNGRRDFIRCGAGADAVRADRRDRVAASCERVRRG